MSDTTALRARLEQLAEDLEVSAVYGHDAPVVREAIAALAAQPCDAAASVTHHPDCEDNACHPSCTADVDWKVGPSFTEPQFEPAGRAAAAPAPELSDDTLRALIEHHLQCVWWHMDPTPDDLLAFTRAVLALRGSV